MRLYHVSDDTRTILERGFQDGPGFYRDGKMHRGVWLFDRPIEAGEDRPADSRTVVVDVPDDPALRHEWLDEPREYRQFLIPASVVNRYLQQQGA